jgi:hypothetical protein
MTFFNEILKVAKKGNEDDDRKEKPDTDKAPKKLTADEEAIAKNIIDMLNTNQQHQQKLKRREEDRIFETDVPRDINGDENHTNEPVFYQPHTSNAKKIPGVAYAVSDVDYMCNQCTRHKRCKRHRERRPHKTDISLCSESHLRMVLYWDISDPENREKTWQFAIEEYYDRYKEPERERDEHELAEKRAKSGKPQDEDCKPLDPVSRVKGLAARISQDHNNEQENIARIANLDSKGREFYTKPKDWHGKDPFKPSEASKTRAAHEHKSADASRIEMELRALLQAWYRSKLSKSERGIDRTTVNANETWRQKMEAQAARKSLGGKGKSEHGEKIANPPPKGMKLNASQMKRFEMSTREMRERETELLKIEAEKMEEEETREAKEVRKKVVKKVQKRKAVFESSESEDEKTGKKPRVEEMSNEKLAMFEQMTRDVEDEVRDNKKKTPEPIAKTTTNTVAHDLTAEERKLLQNIKQAQDEVVLSEEELDAEPEVEEEEMEDSEKPKALSSKGQKVAEASRPPKPVKKPAKEKAAPKPKSEKCKVTTSSSRSEPTTKKSKKEKVSSNTTKPEVEKHKAITFPWVR